VVISTFRFVMFLRSFNRYSGECWYASLVLSTHDWECQGIMRECVCGGINTVTTTTVTNKHKHRYSKRKPRPSSTYCNCCPIITHYHHPHHPCHRHPLPSSSLLLLVQFLILVVGRWCFRDEKNDFFLDVDQPGLFLSNETNHTN
jgi:hypothetical protein